MRQAGFLAAAGIYALDHQVERLKEDHHRARVLGQFLVQAPHVAEVLPVATNIVIARLEGISPETYLQQLATKGIKGVKFGKDLVRFVTHLDFSDDHLEEFGKRIGRI
jgi:threonine aldolase